MTVDEDLANIPLGLTILFNIFTISFDIVFCIILQQTSTRIPKPNQNIFDQTSESNNNNNNENSVAFDMSLNSISKDLKKMDDISNHHNCCGNTFLDKICHCFCNFRAWLLLPKYPDYFFEELTTEKKRLIAKQYLMDSPVKKRTLSFRNDPEQNLEVNSNFFHRIYHFGKKFAHDASIYQQNRTWKSVVAILRIWITVSGMIFIELIYM